MWWVVLVVAVRGNPTKEAPKKEGGGSPSHRPFPFRPRPHGPRGGDPLTGGGRRKKSHPDERGCWLLILPLEDTGVICGSQPS